MKSTLRISAITLALLAPLGATFAQPGFGPGPGPAAAAAHRSNIERFVVKAEGTMRTGSQLTFRVIGTPKARVELDVPGVLRNVVMREVRPGQYEFSYTLRRNDDFNAYRRANATMERAGRRDRADVEVVNAREFALVRPDTRPPQIVSVSPAQGERVRERGDTEISIRVKDDQSGVDRAGVTLRVDGRDVTNRIRVDDNEIRYRDDLRDGRHTAEVVVRDHAGNVTRRSWNFQVVDRGGPGPRR